MLIAPNRGLSLNTKAILPWANPKTFARYEEALTALGKRFGFTLSTPAVRVFSRGPASPVLR